MVDHIVERCTEAASGGRMIDAILTNSMLPDMSVALLERRMRGDEVRSIAVAVDGDALTYRFDGASGAADGAVA